MYCQINYFNNCITTIVLLNKVCFSNSFFFNPKHGSNSSINYLSEKKTRNPINRGLMHFCLVEIMAFGFIPLFQTLQQQCIFPLPRCLSLALFPVCHPPWTHQQIEPLRMDSLVLLPLHSFAPTLMFMLASSQPASRR